MTKTLKASRGILVIGTGYVGLVTGICFAEMGNKVICVDVNQNRIDNLKKGIMPFYEPSMKKLLTENMEKGNITFTVDLAPAVCESEMIFIAVGTPSENGGKADLSYVKKVVSDVGKSMDGYKLIVMKSTVPPGTCVMIGKIIRKKYDGAFDIVSNPEFLREGSAVEDFMKPDRVIVGAESKKARAWMKKLYEPLNSEIFFTDFESSEMIKYSSNAFLATKISFINEIASLCENIGANIEEVSIGIGLDQRIGKDFLKAGLGYGGSCFPKDVRALCQTAEINGCDFCILKSVMEVNNNQRRRVIEKTKKVLGSLKGKTIGIWGLSFKPNTDDVRESAAIEIIEVFLRENATIKVYDPIATKNAKKVLPSERIIFCDNLYEAIDGCDLLLIATDWEEFGKADINKMRRLLKRPYVIDGRNMFDMNKMKKAGLSYMSVGR